MPSKSPSFYPELLSGSISSLSSHSWRRIVQNLIILILYCKKEGIVNPFGVSLKVLFHFDIKPIKTPISFKKIMVPTR